jgi:hypothetical protein
VLTCAVLLRGGRRGWESRRVLLTLVYTITRLVLAVMTIFVRREVSKDVELLVLRHENAVLRRQVKRVRYRPADRVWLSALARLISRHRWAAVFGVSPDTLLRWHRRFRLEVDVFAPENSRPAVHAGVGCAVGGGDGPTESGMGVPAYPG